MSEARTEDEKSLAGKIGQEIKETLVTIAYFLPIWFVFMTFAFELRSIPSESMVPTLQVGDRVAVSKFTYGYSKHSVPFGLGKYLPLGDGRLFGKLPKRGDVVVFEHPHDSKTMIKRLIGIPGDEIQIRNDRVILNGELLDINPQRRVTYRDFAKKRLVQSDEYEETLPNGPSYPVHEMVRGIKDNTPVFIVPEGHYFFMGDNRDNSTDSRSETGHCPSDGGIISQAGCSSAFSEPSIGFVPYDNLVGRAETVFFTLNFCGRYESGCPEGRVWRGL